MLPYYVNLYQLYFETQDAAACIQGDRSFEEIPVMVMPAVLHLTISARVVHGISH